MDPLTGAGQRDPRNAAIGAGEASVLRSGAVVVFKAEANEAPGLWRLRAGPTGIVAEAEGRLVDGRAYRVLVSTGEEGSLRYRVLGPAPESEGATARSLGGPVGKPPRSSGAPPAGLHAKAGMHAEAGLPGQPGAQAALIALVREGLPLSRLPLLARLVSRRGDVGEAAGLLARALAAKPDTSVDELEALLDRVFATDASGDTEGGANAETGGGSGGRGFEDGGRKPSGQRGEAEAAPFGISAALADFRDEGSLDEAGFAGFLASQALRDLSPGTIRGRWAYNPFAFILDGVALSGTMRILLPDSPGGSGAIAVSLKAGSKGRGWRFRLDFGGGAEPRLVLGRGIRDDKALKKAAGAFAAESGLGVVKLLAPGEDLDGTVLPLGTDGHA